MHRITAACSHKRLHISRRYCDLAQQCQRHQQCTMSPFACVFWHCTVSFHWLHLCGQGPSTHARTQFKLAYSVLHCAPEERPVRLAASTSALMSMISTVLRLSRAPFTYCLLPWRHVCSVAFGGKEQLPSRWAAGVIVTLDSRSCMDEFALLQESGTMTMQLC